jgi:HSP20 family protein
MGRVSRLRDRYVRCSIVLREAHMSIVKWDPFGELEGIHARLNRMFGERPFRGVEDEEFSFAGWTPAVDIEETNAEYLVKADLPDVKKEDVKVEYENGVLTVEGERKFEKKEENGKKFHKIERGYGKFVRRFGLPTEVDPAKVSAEYREGVLNVHLPKAATTRKAIAVKVA